MSKLKKDLKDKGWSIIESKDLGSINKISKNFINDLKKNKEIGDLLNKEKIFDIDSLRIFTSQLDDSLLNFIRRLYLNKCSENILKSFSSVLVPLFGKKLLIQKFPQIQVHVGYRHSTKTYPHCEMMAAHSPFTYNVWLPFHDIIDNSGIFLIDDELSVKLCDKEIKKNIKSREQLLLEHQIFPKIKYGQALIFNPFVYHGSIYYEKNRSRISVDVRFQKFSNPLLQKYNDFFKTLNL